MDRVQPAAVVGDQEEGALVGVEGRLQLFDGRQVEVVGRLVEDEQVDAPALQQRQCSACAFAGSGTLLDGFVERSGLPVQEARSLLAKFGLGGDAVLRTAATLSPGERTRASLGLLMASGANWLVLDEPTNHLDLPAIEQLETALEAFDGTLLLVTHDRRLLEAVALDRTIALSASEAAA